MYRGLYEIPWDTLEHSQGSAVDLPDVFESLASLDTDTRQKAFDALQVLIWNGGKLCTAALPSIPLLIQSLTLPMQLDKPLICQLLANLADGYSHHQQLLAQAPSRAAEVENIEERIQQERALVTQCVDAVLAGIPVYLELLQDSLHLNRMGVLTLLPVLAEEREQTLAAIFSAFEKDDNSVVRAALLMAPVFMGCRDEDWLNTCKQNLNSDEPVISLAAAGALSLIHRQKAQPEVLEHLIHWQKNIKAVRDYELLPWLRLDALADICTFILMVDPNAIELVLPALLGSLDSLKGVRALSVSAQMMHALFSHSHEKLSLDGLSENQLSLLKIIATREDLWESPGEMMQLLSQAGLPPWPDELQEYLGMPITPSSKDIRPATLKMLQV